MGEEDPMGRAACRGKMGENELDGSLEHLAQLFMLNVRKVTREVN